jgi:hypothetical protein
MYDTTDIVAGVSVIELQRADEKFAFVFDH